MQELVADVETDLKVSAAWWRWKYCCKCLLFDDTDHCCSVMQEQLLYLSVAWRCRSLLCGETRTFVANGYCWMMLLSTAWCCNNCCFVMLEAVLQVCCKCSWLLGQRSFRISFSYHLFIPPRPTGPWNFKVRCLIPALSFATVFFLYELTAQGLSFWQSLNFLKR